MAAANAVTPANTPFVRIRASPSNRCTAAGSYARRHLPSIDVSATSWLESSTSVTDDNRCLSDGSCLLIRSARSTTTTPAESVRIAHLSRLACAARLASPLLPTTADANGRAEDWSRARARPGRSDDRDATGHGAGRQ